LEVFGQECEAQCEAPSASHSCGIICCGDVTTPETLGWLAERFGGPIKLVCGNMEIQREEFAEVAKRHDNLEIFSEIGALHHTEQGKNGLVEVNIAFVHKPDKVEELAHPPAGGGKYNFVFYGHTHKPWTKQIGQTLIANPGTLGGVFTAPTFAVLDTETDKLELIKLY